jgi:hypothetical protein
MHSHAMRRILLIATLATLPGVAAAQGSQAGDNGRQPVGADADSPRQAIPNEMTNDGTRYYRDNRVYYQAHDPDRYADLSLWNCDQQPLPERPACRDALYHRDHDSQAR